MKKKLQVFVSSTYLDLIPERQAAVEAILRAGHIPAGMELFAADDRSQLKVIRNWIDESDVYLLILGGRYGSVDSETAKSYTQLEYEYAVELNKPLFAVVMSKELLETRRIEKEDRYEKKHLEEYFKFRNFVLTKVSRFFDDTKDIKLAIHESLGMFLSSREFTGGWVSAAEVSEPKPLIEEIARLTAENAKLRRQIATPHVSTKSAEQAEVDEIIQALDAEKITIPAALSNTPDEITLAVSSLAYKLRDPLVTGVANSVPMGSDMRFLFFDVAPKLAIHGLMERKRAAGGKHDLFATTPLGNRVFAEIGKRSRAAELAQEVAKLARAAKVPQAAEAPVSDAKAVPARKPREARPARSRKGSAAGDA